MFIDRNNFESILSLHLDLWLGYVFWYDYIGIVLTDSNGLRLSPSLENRFYQDKLWLSKENLFAIIFTSFWIINEKKSYLHISLIECPISLSSKLNSIEIFIFSYNLMCIVYFRDVSNLIKTIIFEQCSRGTSSKIIKIGIVEVILEWNEELCWSIIRPFVSDWKGKNWIMFIDH